jgi:hypothetical protein
MLKFLVFEDGQPAQQFPLINAHLLGADQVGVRGEITFEEGAICCEKRAMGPAALAVQFDAAELGCLTLQTTLLPEREEPYLLSLELARHRLMMLLTKQEDWLMFDLPDDHPAARRANAAKMLFVKALEVADDPPQADGPARQALLAAIDASEELALAHAELLLSRRRTSGQMARGMFGCGIELHQNAAELKSSLLAHFDYLRLPMPWRQIEPQEQEFQWKELDQWVEWARKNRVPVLGGPLISFDPAVMPDWLYIVEHDYETLRDLFYEHAERLVNRYREGVTLWNVISGIHVNQHFTLSLEQLMDLTRMVVMLAKKAQNNARTLIEITQPFGEYYAHNQRSIPPLIYADMVLQSGIPIDGFGVKLLMGRAAQGEHARDLLQISSLLDRFNALGKPLHITAAAVPSQVIDEPGDSMPMPDLPATKTGETVAGDEDAGFWRKPWSPVVQGHWLDAVYHIALSKPCVESVAWLDLADHGSSEMPHAGLVAEDLTTKTAFHRVTALRKNFTGSASLQGSRSVGGKL